MADALKGAEGRVLAAENALRDVLIERCRAAHELAARALAMTVPSRLEMQLNPHQAPPPLDLLRRLADLAA